MQRAATPGRKKTVLTGFLDMVRNGFNRNIHFETNRRKQPRQHTVWWAVTFPMPVKNIAFRFNSRL
jgi:hypothetical protein